MAVSMEMSEIEQKKVLRKEDHVVLNVGGVRHETFQTTIKPFTETRLYWILQNKHNYPDYDPEKNEYFFDRHPGAFQQIMNYYRTGKLHCPSDVCGPLFQEELAFWGIDEKQMESCCWSTYTLHREAQEGLKVFDVSEDEDDEEQQPELGENQEEKGEHGGKKAKTGERKTTDEVEQNRKRSTKSKLTNWKQLRATLWGIFDNHKTSVLSKIYVWISLTFVVASVVSLCANTDEHVKESEDGEKVIETVDLVCGIWFTLEFFIRCVTCPNILDFVKQVLNWIDFVAIIPFYLDLALGRGNIISEILVLGRMLRLLRFFNKMSLGFQILKHTLVASSKEMFLLLLLVMIPVLIFAGILHLCESGVINTKFKSIPEAFWWAIITLTTVGYGDMAPMTIQGKIFGSICAAVSMLISALPISIIGANFSLYYRHAQAKLKLPKKPKKVLVGMDHNLPVFNDMCPMNSAKNSAEDLTTEVYVRPARRQRMSLFQDGFVDHRNSGRLRSSFGLENHQRGQTSTDVEETSFTTRDHHKSSLFSTSTKSTTVESPPLRPGQDGHAMLEPGDDGVFENSGFRDDNEDAPKIANGSVTRIFSAGSKYKRNGSVHPMSTPHLMVTKEVPNECDFVDIPAKNTVDNRESKHTLHVPEHDESEGQASTSLIPAET